MCIRDRDKLVVSRARKIQRFLSQPFNVAEVFTGSPGVLVSLEDTIKGFKGIADGEYDDLPEAAFYMVGTIEEAIEKASLNEVDLIVELIGGSDGLPLELCKNSFINGKSVVTANKAMISKHGYDLAKLSEKNDCSLAFEASVAGCIPVIKSLRDGLSGTKVNKITGILNGTCNYILTEMREKGLNFDEVLKDAQDKGYAEADPSFDVDGVDAAQKLSILSAIAFGISPDINNLSISGIREVDVTDIIFAQELGYRIKLLASSKFDNGLVQEVSPCMISLGRQISNVEGVLNAVDLDTELAGSVMLTGYGAGAEPTATAVLSDIITVAQGKCPYVFGLSTNELSLNVDAGEKENYRYYFRLNVIDKSGVLAGVTDCLLYTSPSPRDRTRSRMPSSA